MLLRFSFNQKITLFTNAPSFCIDVELTTFLWLTRIGQWKVNTFLWVWYYVWLKHLMHLAWLHLKLWKKAAQDYLKVQTSLLFTSPTISSEYIVKKFVLFSLIVILSAKSCVFLVNSSGQMVSSAVKTLILSQNLC